MKRRKLIRKKKIRIRYEKKIERESIYIIKFWRLKGKKKNLMNRFIRLGKKRILIKLKYIYRDNIGKEKKFKNESDDG